jgi:ornithine carbamoyltransferase
VAFVGDANNVARSLAECCARLGLEFAIAAPQGYQFDAAYLKKLQSEEPKFVFTQTTDPAVAVQGACCVYTDVWASMGQETEQAERAKAFAPYQVNAALMKKAPADSVFLHCLPARRGEEVTDEVIDSPRSAVVQQAGNRMHVQKGLLAWLLT